MVQAGATISINQRRWRNAANSIAKIQNGALIEKAGHLVPGAVFVLGFIGGDGHVQSSGRAAISDAFM
jgi:hypothetical protein